MADGTTTVLLCGVGGQGTILAADLLASAALKAGCDVKVSEIHGMAQRGGAVTTVVRFGEEVPSMVCDEGSADYILAFETTEALRNLPFRGPKGVIIVNDETIRPASVTAGNATMPEHPLRTLEEAGAYLVPAAQIAAEAGNSKAANVALLGALSAFVGFPEGCFDEAVRDRVPPKTVEANLGALARGRAFIDAGEGGRR